MQGSILGEHNGGEEDGVVAINNEVGIAVGDSERQISALHGEIEELEHKSNGESGDFRGKEERGVVMLATMEKMHFPLRI